MKKFTSRKFLVTLGTVMVAAGGAISGQTEWGHALLAIVPVVLAYLGIQGAADVKAGAPPVE
jgi:hypothetical protein